MEFYTVAPHLGVSASGTSRGLNCNPCHLQKEDGMRIPTQSAPIERKDSSAHTRTGIEMSIPCFVEGQCTAAPAGSNCIANGLYCQVCRSGTWYCHANCCIGRQDHRRLRLRSDRPPRTVRSRRRTGRGCATPRGPPARPVHFRKAAPTGTPYRFIFRKAILHLL